MERSCTNVWPKERMSKVFSLTWFSFVVISTTVLAVLYTRVVYTLWFKRNNDNELTNQQKV